VRSVLCAADETYAVLKLRFSILMLISCLVYTSFHIFTASGFATAPSVAMFKGDEVPQVCVILSLSHQSQLL
jgi:hypothetical protein